MVPEISAIVLIFVSYTQSDVVPGGDGVRLLEMQAICVYLQTVLQLLGCGLP